MIKSKKQMYTVIGAFALVMLLTTITYAFFNYTRTGVANNIRTGRIYFNSTQNGTLNLTNLFPVASSEVGNDNQIEVRVYGDTTYAGGEEFEVSLVSVNNTITSGSTEKTIPVNYIATYAATPVATGETANNTGTSSNDYFNDRGSTTAVYQLKAAGEVSEGEQVLIGYIPKDVAVDGTLTIKAYLDASNIAISDTYPSGNVTHTESSGETSVEVVDYTNGTTSEWVGDRTVLTTDEWNTLQNTPISFKVKIEANEGIWIDEPTPDYPIPSCPGCKFIYTTNDYYYSEKNYNSTPVSKLADITANNEQLYDNYIDVVNLSGRNYFIGIIINDSTTEIERAFACGIKGESPNNGVPFCIEGALDDSKYNNNLKVLNDPTTGIWQNSCTFGSSGPVSYVQCNGNVLANTNDYGTVWVADNVHENNCSVTDYGKISCNS